jgi:uncharacterized membrane protein
MSGKIKMIFIGSLFLNVFLVGIMVGNMIHVAQRKDFIRRPFAEPELDLPDDKKELFFKTMEKVYRENRNIHKEIRQARQRITTIMSQSEFDEEAYDKEVQKIHELRVRMMQKLADATKELAQQLNQEERKALAEHLKHPPPPPSFQNHRPQRPSGGDLRHPKPHKGHLPRNEPLPPHERPPFNGPPPHDGSPPFEGL